MDYDLQLARHCVDSFSAASELGCVLTDKDGNVLHQCGNNYTKCRICALSDQDPQRCCAAHRYGLHEAERFGGKYIYFCAMGLTCFTSPVMGRDGVVAQITAGPFLMVDVQDYIAYDLNEESALHPERMPRLMEEVRKLPYMETQRVSAFSELLFMSAAVLSKGEETERMIETEHSVHIQGHISDYLFHIKQIKTSHPYPFREEKRFLHSLSRGDQSQTQELLNDLLGHIMFESGGKLAKIRNRIHELLVLTSRNMIDSGGDPVYVESCIQKCDQHMTSMENVEEICLLVSKVVRSLMDGLFSNRHARHSDMIYRTIQYLQSNYSRKLTLDEIAHNVFVSPTYLSRVFKRETGSSLVDFLNRIRIEKSKELLADESIRLIEVAMECGFESQSYFNRMFKTVCEMTPQQYRKLVSEKTV